MPNREDVLREKTHKDGGVDLGRRVFYTLSDDKALQAFRNTKAISLLMNHLHEKGLLDEDAIDEMLLQCVM